MIGIQWNCLDDFNGLCWCINFAFFGNLTLGRWLMFENATGCMNVHTNDKDIRVEWWHDAGLDAEWHCRTKATQMLPCLKSQVPIGKMGAVFVWAHDGHMTIHWHLMVGRKQGAGFVQMQDGHMTINQHFLHFLNGVTVPFESTLVEVRIILVPCSQIFNPTLVSKLRGTFWKAQLGARKKGMTWGGTSCLVSCIAACVCCCCNAAKSCWLSCWRSACPCNS